MLYLAMLGWIGWEMLAPTWYWVCWYILGVFQILEFGRKMYEGGRKKR